jgi:hypothetical protein
MGFKGVSPISAMYIHLEVYSYKNDKIIQLWYDLNSEVHTYLDVMGVLLQNRKHGYIEGWYFFSADRNHYYRFQVIADDKVCNLSYNLHLRVLNEHHWTHYSCQPKRPIEDPYLLDPRNREQFSLEKHKRYLENLSNLYTTLKE